MTRYERVDKDKYRSAPWVVDALIGHYNIGSTVWEPAAGEGDLSARMKELGKEVFSSDVESGVDFLNLGGFNIDRVIKSIQIDGAGRLNAVVTNPPYSLADEFIHQSFDIARPRRAVVAMLLYHRFDCAKKRLPIFRDHPHFAMKLTLTKRMLIPGFQHTASPRHNHAWFVWDFNKDPDKPASMTWE